MTKRLDQPELHIQRKLNQSFRAIVPVRQLGGSTIISLPKAVRSTIDIQAGDRILLEFDSITGRITIEKDSEGARQRAINQIDNHKEILKYLQYLKRTREYGDEEWCRRAEKLFTMMAKHLRGERLDRAENDQGEDLSDNDL